jgi:four helix bundle protein
MKNNIVQEKSFAFAVRIVNMYKYLGKEKNEFILSKQLLRSGTSIGANVEEAIGAQSKRDFIAKLAIAYKEAREANYWIRLLAETDYFTDSEKESLIKDVTELQKIIAKIRITSINKP